MEHPMEDSIRLVKNSALYKEFLAEREEILRHKWIESEKAGCDIGFERALMDWIITHRSVWFQTRRRCTQYWKTTSENLATAACLGSLVAGEKATTSAHVSG